jgi:iron complex transport system permease protein
MNNKIFKKTSLATILIILPIFLFFASFLIGRYPVSPLDVIVALGSVFIPVKTSLSPAIYTVVWDIRLPQ